MKPPGYVAVFTVKRIYGWAWDPDRPDEPIDIELVHGRETLLTMCADQLHTNLARSGIGNGHHGFELCDLDYLAPTVRRNVTIRRAYDGKPLLGVPADLIPIAGPHLLIVPGAGEWYVAFGLGRYKIVKDANADRFAALLPISIAEPDDDVLPELGVARVLEEDTGFTLLLQPNDGGRAIRIPIPGPDRETPLLRWCRGRPSNLSWVGTDISIEVENTIGIEFVCYLGDHVQKEPKPLEVSAPGTQREFMLNRGAQTTISFRVPRATRHRISMKAGPEPESRDVLGFQLLRLKVLGRPQPEVPPHNEQ